LGKIIKIPDVQIPGLYGYWFFIFFLVATLVGHSQEKRRIDILNADYLDQNKNIVGNAQRLIGNVEISHNDVLMWCDSAYYYVGTNKIDAFGNVHINQGDSIHLYARNVFYDGDISFAQAKGNVKLVKQGSTLYTDTLDYKMDENIGYYDDTGRIVDSTKTLSSQYGRYFVNLDIIDFFVDVEVVSDDFTLHSDTLKYNTVTGKIFITGPTTIKDSVNTLYAEDGWYDSNTGYAELLKNPVVTNDRQTLKANIIKYNRQDGNGLAHGDITITDNENQLVIKGMNASYNDNMELATISDSALLILYSDKDSLYLHADTLMTIPDTVDDEKIIKAYMGVKFYRTDIQGACDSLVYFSKDSTAQMFSSPILWSGIRQMTADYIEMKAKSNAPDEIMLNNNSFIISKRDSIMFDQIKGKNMVAYIQDKSLKRIDVNGNGQTLYYAQDENEIIGLNKAESSKLSITFKDGKVFKISFLSSPEGVLNPILKLTSQDRKLNGFEWREQARPLSYKDVFRK